jgi:23S rRNA (cytosine1962-C5)-methyltransferase
MLLLTPENFPDYQLLDCGDFEKMERFGKYITIRPEPQAVWSKKISNVDWEKMAHVKFFPKTSSSGEWKKLKEMPDRWNLRYKLVGIQRDIEFRLALTSFKHVGVFPEQAVNWEYIAESFSSIKVERPKFLNLFAYTGGASLAAKAAGADVTHLDSIKQVVSWARDNQDQSGLSNIRWLVEDALKYVKREVKRGNKYHGIILDPPAYGNGPEGEKWKLEDNIREMIHNVLQLLDEKNNFLILNAYSLGFSPLIIENLLKDFAKDKLEIGELYLSSKTNLKLPLGVFGRFRSF